MFLLLTSVFIASLLGSLHCVGMCGPFALLANGSSGRPSALPTLAYSSGRLLTYVIVGAVFGTVGLAINLMTTARGETLMFWQQSATLLAGCLMILVGAIALVRYLGWRVPLPRFATPLQLFVQKAFQRVKGLPPIARAGAIGALTSLMPCGWLYTFALTAAGTGSPWWGAVLMFVFWAGTVPILTLLMLGASRLQFSLNSLVPAMMAMLAIGVGVYTIAFRSSISLAGMHANATTLEDLVTQVQTIDQESLPCCECENEANQDDSQNALIVPTGSAIAGSPQAPDSK